MRSFLKSLFVSPGNLARKGSRAHLRLVGNDASAEVLEHRTLLTSQLVASDVTTANATPGSTIDVPVFYSTLDANGDPAALRATLISTNLHFDSSALTYVSSSDIFAEDIVVVPNTTRLETDSAVSGDDNDAATDTVIVAAYSDTPTPITPENTGWPNNPTTEGLLLYTARFTVNAGFTGTTNINFSANATGNVVGQAASFDFQSMSLAVNEDAGNADPVIGSAATASVAENQTAAIDVDATDADNDTLTYSIAGGADASLFAINSTSGVVTFVAAPDFEVPADVGADNVYDVNVSVADGNGGSATQALQITVTDVADNANPVITSAATASVAENQTAAISVVATDVDGDTLSFSLSGTDAPAFAISATGVVTFVAAPDFEAPTDSGADNVYNLTVGVDDGNGGTASQQIAITVTDVRDTNEIPVITSGNSASVAENQTSAIAVVATDADGDTLTFSLSGTDSTLFAVSSTGVVTFTAAPDFEVPADANADNVYNFTVAVDDGNNGTASQNIAVTVTDVNDNNSSPVITSGASASVAENQTSAISVVATDADGDTLTYSLSGTDASLFSVSSTGVVTFNAAPDFETPADAGANNVYDVTVGVADGNGGTASQNIAITVTDVVESTDGTGTIEGRKFNDQNGNGTRDASEPFLNGWTIELVNASGTIVQTQVTADRDINNDGQIDAETETAWYQFTADVGTFTVQEVIQDGWVQTAPVDGLAVAAFALDSQLGLLETANNFENWGGLGEMWVFSDSGDWYYITPDGSFFEWDGSPSSNLTGTLLDTFSSEYHDDVTLLTDAQAAEQAAVDVVENQTVTLDFGNQLIDDVVDPVTNFDGQGDVQVRATRSGNLILTGDSAGNGVRIFTNASGFVTIEGLGATTIAGLSEPYVLDGVTAIAGRISANLNGGDDAVIVQDIQVGRNLNINTHSGNDFVLIDNVTASRSVNLRSRAGDNTFQVSNSQIGNAFTVRTGDGSDMVSTDSVTVGGRTVVSTRGGDDLFATQATTFSGNAVFYAGAGNDQMAAIGSNTFSRRVVVNGGSGTDAADVGTTTFSQTPVVRRIELDTIADTSSLLDSVMQRLALVGLGDVLAGA